MWIANDPMNDAPAYIYVLRDPRTNEARYVGQSSQPKIRLQQHRKGVNEDKREWIAELAALGLEPVIETVEQIPGYQAADAELKWINHFRDTGATLLNSHSKPANYRRGKTLEFWYEQGAIAYRKALQAEVERLEALLTVAESNYQRRKVEKAIRNVRKSLRIYE